MTQYSNVRVIGDIESFIDSLLAHTEEENCQHSVSDFLKEYFDNKNKNKNVNEKRETGSLPDMSARTNANNNQSKFQQGVSLS